MLALAGALMSRPTVLMIDELSLGLAPTVVAQLLEVVRDVHRRGTTVVIVEQSVNVALELAERAVFMEKGQIRFEGKTKDLLARPDLLRSVFIAGTADFGRKAVGRGSSKRPKSEELALDVRGVAKRYGGITAVDDVDFTVAPGEIVGIIGHNGAGKTTLMDCISGFTEIDGGSVRLNGEDVTDASPRDRAIAGLGRSFQEARLFPTLTVVETLAIACERHVWSRSILADGLRLPASVECEEEVAATVDELVDVMGLTSYRGKLIGELSTGTRRVVDLACILAQQPSVLLLDEPSSGVAQKETEALVGLLERVRARTGCAMVVIEHDMPLLRAICDRMVALELGRVITAGTPEEVLSHPQVIESYLGTDAATINRSGKKPVRSKDAPAKRRVPARTSR
jgi:branched-chain amino acid transport system ATP-binding protein